MGRNDNPLERTSVQLMLFVAAIALFANSAVDRTDDGLPWEVTLTGFCVFAVVFGAIYAKKTEIALSVVFIIAIIMPTYYVNNFEVPADNWPLGSEYGLKTTKEALLQGVFRAAPNASRFDKFLPFDVSLSQLSVLPPGIALRVNTSEIYHSELQLSDPVLKDPDLKDADGNPMPLRLYDYLLINSPRKVGDKTKAISLLAKVHTKFDVWPKNIEDLSLNLESASNIVQPPTMFGELKNLEKGAAIAHLQAKYNLRPFMMEVYRVEYFYE